MVTPDYQITSKHTNLISLNNVEDEVCPSCGLFEALDAKTGWCAACTNNSAPSGVCIRCGRDFNPDNEGRRVCSTCRKHEWFERNGDLLDRLLARGLKLPTAIKYVATVNRPTCLCCGNIIPNRTRGTAKFCSRTKACRRATRSFRYYRDKGLNAQDALEKVKAKLDERTQLQVHGGIVEQETEALDRTNHE